MDKDGYHGYDKAAEDEEFNRIEREAKQRLEAVKDTIRYRDAFPKDYRLPKPWVGLTDEEIWGAVGRIGTSNSDVNPYQTINDARAIEKLLKEKNEM